MAAALLALQPADSSGCRISLDAPDGTGGFFGTCSVHGRVRLTGAAVDQAVRLERDGVEDTLTCPGPWRPHGVVVGPWGRS